MPVEVPVGNLRGIISQPGFEDIFKRMGRILFGLCAVALILLDGRQFVQNLSFGSTLHLLRTFTPGHLAGFLGVSIVAVWLTFLYDFTAVRRLGLPISTLRIMKVSWISNTFNNVAGFGGLGGAGARMLLYKNTEVSEKVIQRMSLLIIPAAVTGLGCLMLLNLTGLTGVAPLIHEYKWLPVLIAGFASYIPIYCWFTDIRISWRRLNMSHSPNREETRTRLILTAVSALDWSAAAFVLWFILRSIHPGISLLQAAGLFSIATAAGITSMIPGGIGTFDLMLLSGLQAYGTTSEEALASLLLFRFFYYAVPLLISAVLAVGELSPHMLRFGKGFLQFLSPPAVEHEPLISSSPNALIGEMASKALSVLVFSGGLLLVASAATPGFPSRIRFFADVFSMPILQISHRISLAIGLVMLLLADEIRIRIRRAWLACLVLLVFGGIFTFMKGMDFEEMFYLAVVFLLLWLSKPVFNNLSTPTSFVRVIKPMLLTAVMAAFYILSGQPHPIAFLKTHSGISMLHFTSDDFINNGIAALGLSWLIYAFWLKTMERPDLGILPPAPEDFVKLEVLLKTQAGNSHTHLLFLRDKSFFWALDDTVLIPYKRSGDCLVALGEPLGNRSSQTVVLEKFRNAADRYGLTPVLYQVTESLLPILHDQGFDFFKLGEEAFVELTDFDLNKSHFKGLRNARNRIEREGFRFELLETGASVTCMDDLRHISDAWLSGRHEKQFSLGFFDEEYLEKSPVALIRSKEGLLVAFASLMPAYHDLDEISVDLMRYVPESPNGLMDYLFLHLMLWAKETGYKRFNFGMAPLSNVGRTGYPSSAERLAGFLYDHGNRLYSFEGLHQYKNKFQPDWRPRYLAYPRKANLTRVIVSVANLINRGKTDEAHLHNKIREQSVV